MQNYRSKIKNIALSVLQRFAFNFCYERFLLCGYFATECTEEKREKIKGVKSKCKRI